MNLVNLLDYLCAGLCGLFCLIHIIYSIVHNIRMNKKIDKLCDKCGLPIYSGDDHLCPKGVIDNIGNIFVSPGDGSFESPNAIITPEQLNSLKIVLDYLRSERGDN